MNNNVQQTRTLAQMGQRGYKEH